MLWAKEICEVSGNNCVLSFSFTKPVNIKCFDVYIGEKDFIVACNNSVKRFFCTKKFDRDNLGILEIKFNSQKNEFSCELPCYSDDECNNGSIDSARKDEFGKNAESDQDILKLNRITNSCKLFCDQESVTLEERYGYGFGSQLTADTSLAEESLRSICKISHPSRTSPVLRTITRERDELKDFCQDQYKLNFVKLQVPEGLGNPMIYTFNYNDHKLSSNEQYILDNIKKKKPTLPVENQSEIDCGLISILLAICYDLRTTHGEPTCESGWTRSILSSVLSYFEPLESLRSTLEIFLRRTLIYPLYRNYELSRLCISDTIDALHRGPDWIIKQLLTTYDLFLGSADSRQLLNNYYIEHYLRYVSLAISRNHLQTLGRNLKNVSLDVTKKKLRLNLPEIEAELLRELIDDMHLANSDDSDDNIDESFESDEETDSGDSSEANDNKE